VLTIWNSQRFFPQAEETRQSADAATQQAQYMREVRLRHHDDLAAMNGGKKVLMVSWSLVDERLKAGGVDVL